MHTLHNKPAGIDSPGLEELGHQLAEIESEINKLYWCFTRQARAKPVPGYLHRQRAEIEDQIDQEIKRLIQEKENKPC